MHFPALSRIGTGCRRVGGGNESGKIDGRQEATGGAAEMAMRYGKFNHAYIAFWRLRPHLNSRKIKFYSVFKTIIRFQPCQTRRPVRYYSYSEMAFEVRTASSRAWRSNVHQANSRVIGEEIGIGAPRCCFRNSGTLSGVPLLLWPPSGILFAVGHPLAPS